MTIEIFLIGKLLASTVDSQSTPKAVARTKVHTEESTAALGGPVLPLLDPRAPVALRPDQVAERYYRRPRGLD